MNLSKNVKFLAISVVSIGTLYLGYLQYKKFQKRLLRLERDVRVLQNNIENTRREQFVPKKNITMTSRQVTPSTTLQSDTKSSVIVRPTIEKVVQPVTTNRTKSVFKTMNIDEIGGMSNEQLDKLEAELKNYDETESEYDDDSDETLTEDEEDMTEDVPEELTTTTVTEDVVPTVEEPLANIHILNDYINVDDDKLHDVFSKNTCPQLRDLLKQCGLSSGGKKEVLIQRLITHKKSITSISTNE